MKNITVIGVFALGMMFASPSESASLLGDDITGVATQGTSGNLFSPDNAIITADGLDLLPEFSATGITGELDPDGSPSNTSDITLNFDFGEFEFDTSSLLEIVATRGTSSGPFLFTDVTVTFSSLDFGLPDDYILTGIVSEDPSDPSHTQGLSASILSNTSMELTFTDFLVGGDSRKVGLFLEFAENTGPSAPVVPAPPGVMLGLIGLGGAALARRIGRS